MTFPALMLAMLAGAGAYDPPVEIPAGCRLTHILADGRRIETDGPAGPAHDGHGVSASAASHSAGASSSSVSVSSSSSSGAGRAVAIAESDGRKVTTIRDERGCRIVVDDRPAGDRP